MVWESSNFGRLLTHYARDEAPVSQSGFHEKLDDDRERAFQPQHARFCVVKLHALIFRAMRCVVSCNNINDAIQQSLAQSQRVMLFAQWWVNARSEEHTSELQSRFDLVCRL